MRQPNRISPDSICDDEDGKTSVKKNLYLHHVSHVFFALTFSIVVLLRSLKVEITRLFDIGYFVIRQGFSTVAFSF